MCGDGAVARYVNRLETMREDRRAGNKKPASKAGWVGVEGMACRSWPDHTICWTRSVGCTLMNSMAMPS